MLPGPKSEDQSIQRVKLNHWRERQPFEQHKRVSAQKMPGRKFWSFKPQVSHSDSASPWPWQ
jgi:hypothetical protein